jgi:uracil-DNA glycosylase
MTHAIRGVNGRMPSPRPPDAAREAEGSVPHPALVAGARRDLGSAREAAAGCTACDLWARATQTVFGEGPAHAPLFLLGEQPGDREDIEGHPFVGPAGELLGRALDDAGIRREDAFVSNVVKHFKWKPQGKRRLHDRPNAAEIRACRPWLDLELDLVRPEVLVLLGATAANAVLGPRFRLTEQRGTLLEPDGGAGPLRIATFHPSAVLRARDAEARRTTYEALVADLEVARQRIRRTGSERAGSRTGDARRPRAATA